VKFDGTPLTIGIKVSKHGLSTCVGMGSSSHDFTGAFVKIYLISSVVTGENVVSGVPSNFTSALNMSYSLGDYPRVELRSFLILSIFPRKNLPNDILNSNALQNPTDSIDELGETYNTQLSAIVDKHAPVQSKTIILRPDTKWYTEELRSAKQDRRKGERKMQKSKLTVDIQIYRENCK
jgi:hypothetical protein